MKKPTALILSLLLAAALCSCGRNDPADSPGTSAASDAIRTQADQSGNAIALPSEDGTETADAQNGAGYFSDRDLSAEYDSETVLIGLTGSGAQVSSDHVTVSGSTVTIFAAGTYVISGSLTNGSLIVDAGKEDKIQLVLNGVSIHSDTYAALYVKQADKVFLTLADGTENTLSNGGGFVQTDANNVDAVVFSKDDLTLNGTGTLKITSPAGHGIVGKDEVTITNGTYVISAADHAISANDSIAVADGTFALTASKDGLHAENDEDATLGSVYIEGGSFTIRVSDDAIHANTLLQIENGSFTITAAEGLEATYVLINGGTISIAASDDGINAARKSSAYTPTVEINGGEITITMGAGDTDGIDSNGNLIITGGTISISGQSGFDYDGTVRFTGGTVLLNGRQLTTISNQMMGGQMNGQAGGGMGGGQRGWY